MNVKRKSLREKVGDKTLSIIEKFDKPLELVSTFFRINLKSFEYFFFSLTLLILGREFKGAIPLLIIILSAVFLVGGFLLGRWPSRKKIEKFSLLELIVGLLVLFLIFFIFISISYKIIISYRT